MDAETKLFEDLILEASKYCKKGKNDLKFTFMKCLPEVSKRSRTTRAVRNISPIKQEIEKVINKDILNIVDKPSMASRHKSYSKLPDPLPRYKPKKVFVPTDKPIVKDPMVQCPVCERKFGPKAAGRHIRFCQDKVK